MCAGNQTKLVLGIEAKLWSGKSSEADKVQAPKDQLAREWDNLTYYTETKVAGPATPALLYVTADIAIPGQDIEDSAREFASKRRDQHRPEFRCAWVSWRSLVPLFAGAERPLSDLARLADRLDLRYYEGITDPGIEGPLWTYGRGWLPYIETLQFPIWSYSK